MSSRVSGALALTAILLLAHCAWQRPGVSASIVLASDDPRGERRVLDAIGREHTLERAVLSIARVSLVRCPGDAESGLGAVLGPSIARAHGPEDAVIGPFDLDLLADDPVLATVAPLPARYCDVRVAVTGLSLSTDAGALRLEAALDRERVLRTPEHALDAPGDHARIVLTTRTSELLGRLDPASLDPALDALRALDAAVASIEVAPGDGR